MRLFKRLGRQRWAQVALGVSGARYLRLVAATNRLTVEPHDFYEQIAGDLPVIVAMWHGQHALMSFMRRPEHRAKALISRHRDGEIQSIALNRLGVETIRGSGDHRGDFHRKGGVGAFRDMLAALAEGHTMVLTADVPKIARVCGSGIIKLAAMSGRPIYPVAVATSRRLEFRTSWDRGVLNLPFGHMAAVAGDLVRVSSDADDDALERARLAVETGLNRVTARAYEIVDGGRG